MNDIQNILDITFPFVEKLLKDYGEFYPLASVVNLKYEVEQLLLPEDEENDFPKSIGVIGEIKKELRWKRDECIAIAIFYDVKLKEKVNACFSNLCSTKTAIASVSFSFNFTLFPSMVTIFLFIFSSHLNSPKTGLTVAIMYFSLP